MMAAHNARQIHSVLVERFLLCLDECKQSLCQIFVLCLMKPLSITVLWQFQQQIMSSRSQWNDGCYGWWRGGSRLALAGCMHPQTYLFVWGFGRKDEHDTNPKYSTSMRLQSQVGIQNLNFQWSWFASCQYKNKLKTLPRRISEYFKMCWMGSNSLCFTQGDK